MADLDFSGAIHFLETRPWPRLLKYRIALGDFGIVMHVWRDNIDSLNADDKLAFAQLINPSLGAVGKRGIPVTIKVNKGDVHG